MKEITVLNNINKLVEEINYKSLYLEIQTRNNTYIIEKKRNRQIGFYTGEDYGKYKQKNQ